MAAFIAAVGINRHVGKGFWALLRAKLSIISFASIFLALQSGKNTGFEPKKFTLKNPDPVDKLHRKQDQQKAHAAINDALQQSVGAFLLYQ